MNNRSIYVYLAAAFSALGGLLFGYDTGVISGAILFIRQDFHLDHAQIEWLVSAVLVGCIIGSSFGGMLADRFGRRRILLIAATLFTLASVLTALAPDPVWLSIGRIFIGIAIGFSSMVTPLYIAEISPAPIRGALVSLNQLAITVGILASYLINYALSGSGSWEWMLGLAAVPSIIFGTAMFFLPESPRWLYKEGKIEEAHHLLIRIHGDKEADHERREIEQSIQLAKQKNAVVMTPWVKRALLIGIGLAIFQQLTGINTVIYYAPLIFEFVGFTTAAHALLATGVIGVVNVLATVVALRLLDKLGRRTLLLVGLVGMIVSLAVLGFFIRLAGASHFLGWVTLGSLIVYIISFAISLGPIFWLLIAEIYPLDIRGKAMSVATVCNWAANLLISFTFLKLVNHLGLAGTFWFYGFLAVLAWVFSYFLVPETKNKTLEEIEMEWNDT